MPVHLFGRPAPVDELRRFGLPIDRGRRPGLRRRRDRDERRLDLQLLPDEEPVRARRRRPDRRQRRRARRADPDAALPRLARQEGVRVHRLQLAPRRAPGGDAAHLPAAPRRLERRAPRGGRRATPSSASASVVELPPDEPGHVYHMYCVRSPERDRLGGGARTRPRSGSPPTTSRRCTSSRRCATSATRRATSRRRRRPRARTSACRCGPGSPRSSRQRSSASCAARRPSCRRDLAFPVNRHRIWQLVADALLIAAAWRLTFFLRFDQTVPPYYRHLLSWQVFALVVAIKLAVFVLFGFYNRWWRYVSTRDMWGAARGVTAACAARLPHPLRLPARAHLAPAAQGRGARLPAPARLRRRHAPARALADRAPAGRPRRARQGGARSSAPATPAQLLIREMQRNRQLAYTPIGLVDDDPRKKNLRIHGVRVLGTTDELATSCATTSPTRC